MCWIFSFNKVAGLEAGTLLRKRIRHRCFFINFVKFLRRPLSLFYRTFYYQVHWCKLCKLWLVKFALKSSIREKWLPDTKWIDKVSSRNIIHIHKYLYIYIYINIYIYKLIYIYICIYINIIYIYIYIYTYIQISDHKWTTIFNIDNHFHSF